MYDGDGPCLREHVARKFGTIFGCVQVCGGMSCTFFKQVTTNSNEYVRTHQQPNGKFGGYTWANVTVQEMIRFHGVLLKMSIDNHNLGGYEAYFIENQQVNLGRDYHVTLTGYPAWAAKVMTLQQFEQIRA